MCLTEWITEEHAIVPEAVETMRSDSFVMQTKIVPKVRVSAVNSALNPIFPAEATNCEINPSA